MSGNSWNERNRKHVELSNNAADHYDSDYAENNFQTRQYMSFEEEELKNALKMVRKHNLAIDLGCGTGRDLFLYASDFEKAIGWDFSQKMVEVTRTKAQKLGCDNVFVEECDVEKEGFSKIEENSVDFINAGFGMGSFIADLPVFLKKVHSALSTDGVFMATFYNKQSIAKHVTTPCFAAMPDTENDTLTVTTDGTKYEIPCISYTVEELMKIFSSRFEVAAVYTYPTITTLLTTDIFSKPEIKASVLELEDVVKKCSLGHYILLVCKKK